MNRLMITVAALALLGAPAAFAQPQGNQNHQNGGHGGNPQGHGQGQGQHGGQPQGGQTHGGPGGPPAGQSHGGPPAQGHGRNGPPLQAGGQSSGQWREGRWQGRGQPGGQGPAHGGRWQAERNDPRFQNYQRNVFAQRRYRGGNYYWPQGWAYRRWSFGQFLPQFFFAQDYWIYDYADYGLPYAPPGCTWVRYGPDALLIDQDTGEIVQVVYGLFY